MTSDPIRTLIRLLQANGIPCHLGSPIGDEETITDPRGCFLAGARILPDGKLAVRGEVGFYMESSDIPTIAKALAGLGPRDWSQNGFRRLEKRSGGMW